MARNGNTASVYAMFTQLLHYVQLALNKGETVPTFLAVIDTEKAALMKSADVLPFMSKRTIRWGKSASQYTQEALDEISATGLHLGISALSAATKLPPATPRKTHFVAVSAVSRHTLRQHRYRIGVHAHPSAAARATSRVCRLLGTRATKRPDSPPVPGFGIGSPHSAATLNHACAAP